MRSALVVTIFTGSYLVQIELELACKRVQRPLVVSSLDGSDDSVADVCGMIASGFDKTTEQLKKMMMMIVGALANKMTVNGSFLSRFIRIVLRRQLIIFKLKTVQ